MTNHRFLRFTVYVITILVLGLSIFAQTPKVEVTELAPKLYMLSTGTDGNVAALITEEGVLVVDATSLPSTGQLIMSELKKLTDKPIQYIVFTHYHYDHTCGIASFPESATIIAHKNVVKNIENINAKRHAEEMNELIPAELKKREQQVADCKAQNDPKLKEAEQALADMQALYAEGKKIVHRIPKIAFETEHTLTLGGQTIQLIYPGCAHTDGDCLVYFPAQKTIHMGDLLFHGSFPYIDLETPSNTKNWIEQLNKVLKMDVVKVIPGHGPLADKTALQKEAQYLTDLRSAVKDALSKNQSLDQMKDAITLPAYDNWLWKGLLKRGIEAVYNELKREK